MPSEKETAVPAAAANDAAAIATIAAWIIRFMAPPPENRLILPLPAKLIYVKKNLQFHDYIFLSALRPRSNAI
jgi:hypothetical protein